MTSFLGWCQAQSSSQQNTGCLYFSLCVKRKSLQGVADVPFWLSKKARSKRGASPRCNENWPSCALFRGLAMPAVSEPTEKRAGFGPRPRQVDFPDPCGRDWERFGPSGGGERASQYEGPELGGLAPVHYISGATIES